jgi:hypothetical protein
MPVKQTPSQGGSNAEPPDIMRLPRRPAATTGADGPTSQLLSAQFREANERIVGGQRREERESEFASMALGGSIASDVRGRVGPEDSVADLRL